MIILTNILSVASYVNATPSSDPATFWNEVTLEITENAKLSPVRTARALALTHVAIYDALLLAEDGLLLGEDSSESSLRAVAAGAASEVLTFLYRDDEAFIEEKENQQVVPGQRRDLGKVISSQKFGHAVAKSVVDYAKKDGSDAFFSGTIPTGDCIWTGVRPIDPLAGTWRTWILESGAEVQPPPPFACGSQKDLAEVQAVMDASLALTEEQIAAVHFWGDRLPPIVWNEILQEEVVSHGLEVFESARAYAYANIALYDAGVSTWLTKYTYWTARPFQRIPDFETVIPTPNFPSYTSGHATFSGAVSTVLGELFPEKAAFFAAQADEAAMSRLWAGIHFPQDNNQGLTVGHLIGEKTVEDMQGPPHPFVLHMHSAP